MDGESSARGAQNDRAPDRLTVQEAAQLLGISEEAVRCRIKRGSLRSVREDGRVYVLVEGPDDDRSRPTRRPLTPTAQLIAELKDRIRALEQANSENRQTIAMLAQANTDLSQRIPAIEAAESPSEASPVPGQAPTEASDEPREEATQRPGEPQRGLWRRLFGG